MNVYVLVSYIYIYVNGGVDDQGRERADARDGGVRR